MMKPNIVALISILTLAFLAGCQDQAPSTDPANEPVVTASTPSQSVALSREQQDLAGIRLGKAQKRNVSAKVSCAARVEVPPQQLASVYTPVVGFVQKVNLLPGNYVSRGKVLTTLKHPDLIRLQREYLESQSRFTLAEKQYQRLQGLARDSATSVKALDEAEAEFNMARAHTWGLAAELDLIGISSHKLAESGEIQSYVPIVAPISGYVASVNINPGKLVSPQDLLMELIDDDHVHLELQVFAKDLHKIHQGQKIRARIPGEEEEYAGKIYLVGKMIDIESKTALVHGHFDKEPVPLTPGTFLQAEILLDEEAVWALPESAIVREGEKAYAFVKKGTAFEKVEVATGVTENGFIALESLAWPESDSLVVEGAYYIQGSMGE